MEVPEIYKGMRKVKEYPNFVLYKNKYYKECFTYYDLGIRTYNKTTKDVVVNYHM